MSQANSAKFILNTINKSFSGFDTTNEQIKEIIWEVLAIANPNNATVINKQDLIVACKTVLTQLI